MASVLIRRVRSSLGEAAVQQLIERAGVPYSAEYLEDLGNWIPYEHAGALMEAAVALTRDEEIVRRAGEDTVRQHAGTAVATLLRSLGSPQAVFEQLTLAATKFSTVIDLVPVEVAPGRAVVRAKAKPGYTRHRRHCEYTQGMLSQPPALFGLPAARVVETSCELEGGDHCLYTVTWDAASAERATDPGELVAALEQQVAAMTDRLENMYATARDLIALDDVDAALTRITERAATAVRAPSYLLAVRVGRGDKLHVHHRGFSDAEADKTARALLGDESVASRASGLVVDVASATRHYGRLMAASPDGAFFPHERDLLDVYARYAAAVLDTATALDEARRRHEEAQALLGLAQSVATANTSQDVAERLAQTVPAVVDCDRAFVFLWDESEQALVCHAVGGDPGPSGKIARELRISPDDTPRLADLRAAPTPDPLFFDAHPDDPFIEATMHATGALALVVVPIVANDRLYGTMNVSVTERPERLAPSPALLDSLAGVVAQAATALDNARLIETMAHQARHDNLTGLLGHRAFHEAIATGLSERDPETFTLAMIDIDDFKQINDTHGHPVGDEALRLVAEALHHAVRDDDRVFRVGGEEFAVLLPGLSAGDAAAAAERLREAVAAIEFRVPLRVSIGLASWPDGAPDRDSLIQHADSALYDAKRAGKDRVSIAA
ncbi:MAG: diguanylate cyclase [Thermoleophilaceae bacterium]